MPLITLQRLVLHQQPKHIMKYQVAQQQHAEVLTEF